MKSLCCLPALLSALALLPAPVTAQRPARSANPTPATFNHPPTIEVEHTTLSVVVGDTVAFDVTVRDAEGDSVTLRMPRLPEGMVFQPVRDGAAPSTGHVHWNVGFSNAGHETLLFEAFETARPNLVVRRRVEVRVTGTLHPGSSNSSTLVPTGIRQADVTGDGVLDVVVRAPHGDTGGVIDAGAIQVFAGGSSLSSVPSATLADPTPQIADGLGSVFHILDLSGDGLDDVVAGGPGMDQGASSDAGALLIWFGGAGISGNPAPDATLQISGGDRLGEGGTEFADLNGDGQLDVLSIAPFAAVSGVNSPGGGVAYVWFGGSPLAGSPVPDATLVVPGSGPPDGLGLTSGPGILIEDVTGDGQVDVVLAASRATVGGVSEAGAIYVWKGGSTLSGVLPPTASLTVPGANPKDKLTFQPFAQPVSQTLLGDSRGMWILDVTGDGVQDVVASAPGADLTNADAGSIYVFAGGASLIGNVAPTATLAKDLASMGMGRDLKFGDLNQDGVQDILARGEKGGGRGFLWYGGPQLSGILLPQVTLLASTGGNKTVTTLFGNPMTVISGPALEIVDVTGDGWPDIVALQSLGDTLSEDEGLLMLFQGQAVLSTVPDAVLSVPNATPGDFLGSTDKTAGTIAMQFRDLTGDSVSEIVVGSQEATVNGVDESGAVYIWQGGTTLLSSPAPISSLTNPTPGFRDWLGHASFGDVTGNGFLDVIVPAPHADVAGLVDRGAIFVREGGPGLASSGSATVLAVEPGVQETLLADPNGLGLLLIDMTEDGTLDLLSGSSLATSNGVSLAGAVFGWFGGPALGSSGSPRSADLTLSAAGPRSGDQIGVTAGFGTPHPTQGLHAADLTGNGHREVLAGAVFSDANGVTDSGAVYVWNSFPPAAFSVTELANPAASPGDSLGE